MKKAISLVMAVIVMISVLPMAAFAVGMDAAMQGIGFTVIENEKSSLAPGVTMNEIVMYNSNKQRVEMYVTQVDTKVDTVQVKANYLDNQNAIFGMQTLSKQVAAMEANYPEPFKVVAGINASYYNTTTGQPTGAFVMEGKDASATGDGYAFFAVLKDGTYMIGGVGDYSKYKDQMQEAIGGYIHIVKKGAIANGLDKTTLYPRQTLGLTADGKLILMTADGSQAPATVGMTVYEQAQVMLALGCVEAIHLDGGNSATFGAVREGTDKFVTVNSPSGGGERDVSNTLMIISTAVASGTFDHAVITGEYEYYAPYSEYQFSAFGVDATNASAQIPETAVWTLSDDEFGTIQNGKFVSNGKLGKVDVQLSDGGKVIGSKSITIAVPTSASFALAETTVPYGKTASLTVTALYDIYSIYTCAKDYTLTVNPAAAGTVNGFQFTAANDESIKNAVVTAKYIYGDKEITDSITVKFGKGSEVLFDFEDGDLSDWRGTTTIQEWIDNKNKENPTAKYPVAEPADQYSNGINKQYSEVFLATEENGGKVKNGKYSLGFRMNHLNLTDPAGWIYNYLYYTGETKVLRDAANGKNAIRIGMWVYNPNLTNVAFRIVRGTENTSTNAKGIKYSYMFSDYDGAKVSYNTNYAVPEAGWMYIYYDLTDITDNFRQTTSLYDPDNNNGAKADGNYYPAFLQLFTGSATDTMQDMIFYIDDITLDYSEVTEDRDAPTISEVQVCSDTANFVALNGQTVTNSRLSFIAKVSDVSGNSNATGLNYTSAKIYIDGIDMSKNSGFKATNGYLILNDVYLANGKHNITFVIFDNQGNETRVTKALTVNAENSNVPTVSVIGHNDGNHTPKAGSVYYIDLKASDASQIKEVATTLKLNSANKFEYNNIICAPGVTATAVYDAKDFELTVTLTHDGSLSGEAVLASVPVRVWAWDEATTGITAADQFKTTAIPIINIECAATYGEITYATNEFDSYVCGFSGALNITTELDNKTNWHTHTATAMADLDATCEAYGYKNRTYCDGCASVVNWGTVLPKAEHTYNFENNKFVCKCGSEKEIGNRLFKVGDDLYYAILGELVSGWIYEENAYYYFDKTTYKAVDGKVVIDGYNYVFEDKALVRGDLIEDFHGLKYMWAGEWLVNSWATIDGDKYYFTSGTYAQVGPAILRGVSGTFLFDENGVWLEGKTGLLNLYGKVYYYQDGMLANAGLVKIGDDFYYIRSDSTPATGDCWVAKPNTAVTGYTAGAYTFGDDGKLIKKIEKHGPVGDYFYLHDVKQLAYQLVEFEGSYYFIYSEHKLAKNISLYMTSYFLEGTGLPEGNYTFDEDGKMVIKNGIIGDYYYVNNVRQNAYKLIEFEGSYYFIYSRHKLAKNITLYMTNQFLNGTGLPEGNYTFDENGKMVIKNGIIDDHYYVNNVRQNAYKLINYEDDYYFIYSNHKIAKNLTLYMTSYFLEGTGLPEGNYTFDENGKMVIKNGIIGDYYYVNNVRQNAYKLINYEGEYYFIYSNHKIAKNVTLYMTNQFLNGTGLPEGKYTFDENGKMVIKNGIIDDYYYVNNVRQNAYKLIKYEGDYYFIYSNHKIAKNVTLYMTNQFLNGTGLPEGQYTFDENGKMLIKNGIIGDYYYVDNVRQNAYQIIEIDGDYYFIGDGNKIVKNKQLYLLGFYLYKYNLPAGYYQFDANGKMILKNGVYGNKFFIDGIQQKAYQLINYQGSYYFVGGGNAIVRNTTLYLTNEFVFGTGLPEGKYTFDANGKMILN